MIYEYLKDIDFAYPAAFALFALLPLLIWWYLKKNDRREPVITVTTIHAFRVSSWKNKLKGLPVFFRLLSMSALILVLARPQKKNEEQKTEGEGIDIVLCMDVPSSAKLCGCWEVGRMPVFDSNCLYVIKCLPLVFLVAL